MTTPVNNAGIEPDLPTFEEACRHSPAPDLIHLVLALANIVQRLKARWIRRSFLIQPPTHQASAVQADTPPGSQA